MKQQRAVSILDISMHSLQCLGRSQHRQQSIRHIRRELDMLLHNHRCPHCRRSSLGKHFRRTRLAMRYRMRPVLGFRIDKRRDRRRVRDTHYCYQKSTDRTRPCIRRAPDSLMVRCSLVHQHSRLNQCPRRFAPRAPEAWIARCCLRFLDSQNLKVSKKMRFPAVLLLDR